MKFTVEYPIERGVEYSADLLRPDALTAIARTAEDAGFDAIGFSEHPAPSRKWKESGGHDTFDPLAALTYCAAVTTRLRLMPHLLVLPYHNPPMLAKTLSTVDILSGGRLTVAAGTGYLRSEFAAVGSDFEQRNALFDEAVATVREAWSGEPYHVEGTRFLAVDQILQPRPVQRRLPIWLGGNSPLTRRRVVRYGDGWSPMLTSGRSASSLRTSEIGSVEELGDAVTELRARFAEADRDPATLQVQLEGPAPAEAGGFPDPAAHLDELDRYAKAGVTSVFVHIPLDGVDAALDAMRAYGEQVITPTRAAGR